MSTKVDTLEQNLRFCSKYAADPHPKGTLSPPSAARARVPSGHTLGLPVFLGRYNKVNCPAGAREGPLGGARPKNDFTLFCC